MKWIYRFVTIVIIFAAMALPFFIDNKQGQPMLSLPTVDDITPELPDKTILSGSERTYFKWQDEHGQWHFGDDPPPTVDKVIPVTVDLNANIIQPVKLPEEERGYAPDPVYPPGGGGYRPPGSVDEALTLDRALNLVNDAHAVREMMEARNKALEGLSGENK